MERVGDATLHGVAARVSAVGQRRHGRPHDVVDRRALLGLRGPQGAGVTPDGGVERVPEVVAHGEEALDAFGFPVRHLVERPRPERRAPEPADAGGTLLVLALAQLAGERRAPLDEGLDRPGVEGGLCGGLGGGGLVAGNGVSGHALSVAGEERPGGAEIRSNAAAHPSESNGRRRPRRGTKMAASAMARTDLHGNPMSGPTDGIARYDHALDRLLRYHVDVVPALTDLVTEAPDVPMAQVMAGYLSLTSTDEPDRAGAAEAAAVLAALPLHDREAAHPRSSTPGWPATGTARPASSTTSSSPGRPTCWPCSSVTSSTSSSATPPTFAIASADRCRPSIRRTRTTGSSGACTPSASRSRASTRWPGARGRRPRANPDDVWAVHAMVHTFEMQGHVDEGLRFLQEREADWTRDNIFTVHNWWHRALLLLEAGRADLALELYDAQVHHAARPACRSRCSTPARCCGGCCSTGRRRRSLRPARRRLGDPHGAEPWYVFNDVHATVALAGAGRVADARAVVIASSASSPAAAPPGRPTRR